MRKIFYKINLNLDDGRKLPVTVAAGDINDLEPLVEQNKMIYTLRGMNIIGFEFVDVRYTLNMSEEQYQEELMFCDIVQESVKMENPTEFNVVHTYKLGQ